MRITHFVKTASIITAHYSNGRTETIDKAQFEAWVADKTENEEGRRLTLEEYYSDPVLSLADVQTYLDIIKRKAIVAHTQNMIKSFAV